MKLLVVGGGGREHAIIKKLKENPTVDTIWCAPGNGGIAADARCVDIKATDVDAMVEFAVNNNIDYAVVTPDDPLVLGMADAMRAAGIPAFGPGKAAAQIEGSKIFSKSLMEKYNIPTAKYQSFSDVDSALAYIDEQGEFPVVIKADGLALGKGVIIAQSRGEAEQSLNHMIKEKVFGESGSHVVVEEFLEGPEVSVLAFTDGKALSPMVSSMDHKRALDGNLGPNTGGMGTIAPNLHYTPEIALQCLETIFIPTIMAMEQEGCLFQGCLYFGLMLTSKGPMVIEYNCRFGDPETQVVLPLLESDLLTIMQATSEGTLADTEIIWRKGAAACVIAASGGYPGSYSTGLPITGLEDARDVEIYHAGTRVQEGRLVTSGGRVLGVTAVGATLDEALDKSYKALNSVSFENMHYRRDIGRYR